MPTPVSINTGLLVPHFWSRNCFGVDEVNPA